jgi:hypothetical protein
MSWSSFVQQGIYYISYFLLAYVLALKLATPFVFVLFHNNLLNVTYPSAPHCSPLLCYISLFYCVLFLLY